MDDHHAEQTLAAFADALWTQRHMVHTLLFKLTTARLLLAADDRRFIAPAMDEVEAAIATLRDAEQVRALHLPHVATALGLPADGLTLNQIVEHAPEPFDTLLADHRAAFLTLTEEIEQVADENRQLATAALGRVRQGLDALAGADTPVATYDATGRTAPHHIDPRHLDAAL